MNQPVNFKKIRWYSLFTIVYLIFAVIIAYGAQYAMHDTANKQLVEFGESANAAMARGLAQSLWPRFGDYVSTVKETDGDALRARPETAEIDAAARTAVRDLPILKLKMFNRTGLTIYASDPSQIGDSKHQNTSFLNTAKHGLSGSKMSQRDIFGAFSGSVKDVTLVETYAPIVDAARVVGVFELYTNVTETAQAAYARIKQALLMLIAVLVVGYLIFLTIIAKGFGSSEEHHQAVIAALPNTEQLIKLNQVLQEKNTRLEEQIKSLESYVASQTFQETPRVTYS